MWAYGSAFHKDTPLVAGADAEKAFARKSKANSHFALNAKGGMTNQRAEFEACAAVLMALNCEVEVRLDNTWVKTSVEHMLRWMERRKTPTFRSKHTSVWRPCGETYANSQTPCYYTQTFLSSWQLTNKQRREHKKVSHNNR